MVDSSRSTSTKSGDTLQWVFKISKTTTSPEGVSSSLQGQEAVSISFCILCLHQSLEIPCSRSSRHQGAVDDSPKLTRRPQILLTQVWSVPVVDSWKYQARLSKTLQGGHIFLLTSLLNVSQPYLVPSPNFGPLQSHSKFISCCHSSAFPLHWLTAE